MIELRGKYAIAHETYLKCVLRINDPSQSTLTGECRVRPGENTLLPIGTRIILEAADAAKYAPSTAPINRYTTQVTNITLQQGQLLHEFSPIEATPINERRQQERLTNFFTVKLENALQAECLVTDGTSRGLTLFCTTKLIFSGCSVGQKPNIQLRDDVSIPTEIKHVHYDLQEGKLMIGISTPDLRKRQTDILMSCLDRDYVPEAEKTVTTEISATKISAK